MEKAVKAGNVRAIGVSNFQSYQVQDLMMHNEIKLTVNQIQINPLNPENDNVKWLQDNDIVSEAWGPLGEGNKELFAEPVLNDIAKKYGKDVGQVMLRFEHQEGVIVFPKSSHEARIKSNMDIFDFELTSDEMYAIRNLDKGYGSYNPDAPGVEEMLLNAFDVHAND